MTDILLPDALPGNSAAPAADLPALGGALAATLAGVDAARRALPERALQFGTGAFLRGFVGGFVDDANRRGAFGGRIVAVGSTGSGRDRSLNAQDGLYTLAVRGIAGGRRVDEQRVVSAYSRALSARDQWSEVLATARDPRIGLVFSNTTEVGIALDPDDAADLHPPRSFPGKLACWLHERARTFGFSTESGVVVLPCELIDDNGDRLREIVRTLAERWALGADFVRWLDAAVVFCNTLVDRIVPGEPAGNEREALEAALGYRDAVLTACEPYRLFAIQGDAALRARLGFAEGSDGIVVTEDVSPYRERKVRLLNGTHTLMAPAAILCGQEIVGEAVADAAVGALTRRLLFDEIAPTLRAPGAAEFAAQVLDRFANPFVRHALWDITLQGTMKMRVRNVPTLLAYVERTGAVPPSLAFGFAAWLRLMRGDLQAQRRAAGLPVPHDDAADALAAHWTALRGFTAPGAVDGTRRLDSADAADLVHAVCADESLWGTDLSRVDGFCAAVAAHLVQILTIGPAAALDAHLRSVPPASIASASRGSTESAASVASIESASIESVASTESAASTGSTATGGVG
jgi:tagaturonate reductase